jgi:membrane-bound serine protease (ClpP class)
MGLDLIFALVLVGVLLIICEIFIPGGIVGSIGALALLVGIVGGYTIDARLGTGLLFGSLVFGMLAFWAWMKFFPQSRLGKKMFLQADASQWHGYDVAAGKLLGAEGVAQSMLRPAGIAIIGGKRVDVVTRGEMIAPNCPVKVVTVEGNRVVVCLLETKLTEEKSTPA